MNILDKDFAKKAAAKFNSTIESVCEDGRIVLTQGHRVNIDIFFASLLEEDLTLTRNDLINDLSFLNLYPMYSLKPNKFELEESCNQVLIDMQRKNAHTLFELHYLAERLAVDSAWSHYPVAQCLSIWQETMAYMRQTFLSELYKKNRAEDIDRIKAEQRARDLDFVHKTFPAKVLAGHAVSVLQRGRLDILGDIISELARSKHLEYFVKDVEIKLGASLSAMPSIEIKYCSRLAPNSVFTVEVSLITIMLAHILGYELTVTPDMSLQYEFISNLEKEIVL